MSSNIPASRTGVTSPDSLRHALGLPPGVLDAHVAGRPMAQHDQGAPDPIQLHRRLLELQDQQTDELLAEGDRLVEFARLGLDYAQYQKKLLGALNPDGKGQRDLINRYARDAYQHPAASYSTLKMAWDASRAAEKAAYSQSSFLSKATRKSPFRKAALNALEAAQGTTNAAQLGHIIRQDEDYAREAQVGSRDEIGLVADLTIERRVEALEDSDPIYRRRNGVLVSGMDLRNDYRAQYGQPFQDTPAAELLEHAQRLRAERAPAPMYHADIPPPYSAPPPYAGVSPDQGNVQETSEPQSAAEASPFDESVDADFEMVTAPAEVPRSSDLPPAQAGQQTGPVPDQLGAAPGEPASGRDGRMTRAGRVAQPGTRAGSPSRPRVSMTDAESSTRRNEQPLGQGPIPARSASPDAGIANDDAETHLVERIAAMREGLARMEAVPGSTLELAIERARHEIMAAVTELEELRRT